MSKGKTPRRGRPTKIEQAIRNNQQRTLFDFFENEKLIPIEDIIIGTRKRSEYSNDKVEELAESIQEVGLMNPIVVTKNNELVAGYHRILAFKKLEKTKIPYRVTTITDPLKLELQEIDENLVRGDLSYLEGCEQLLRRKEIYETLHPETKYGVHLKSYSRDSKGRLTNDEKISPLAFSKEISQKMNLSQRTIQNRSKIAKDAILELRDAVRLTKLANRATDLMKISRFSVDYQTELLGTISRMKQEAIEIKTLSHLESQHKLYDMNKQNNENHAIIKSQEKILENVKTHFESQLTFHDAQAYLYVQENGIISWKKYKELQNTTLWRDGKQCKYLLNDLNGVPQPEWENAALHHENPYNWEHLFSKGYIIHKNDHKRGGSLLKKN